MNIQALGANGGFEDIKSHDGGIYSNNFFFDIARGLYPKLSVVHKFGQNPDLDSGDSYRPIWDIGEEYTYSTTADIDSLSSSDDSDTQEIEVQGLDTNWELTLQTITLTGQTRKALDTPLIRVFRMINRGSSDLAGDVYCYVNTAITAGVPDDLSYVRAHIMDGNNQTLMLIYTVPSNYTAYLVAGRLHVYKSIAGVIESRVWLRDPGGVFRIQETLSIHSQGAGADYNFPVPLTIPEKSDIYVDAASSALNMGVSGSLDFILQDNS